MFKAGALSVDKVTVDRENPGGGLAGGVKCFGPALFVDCWNWIDANCRGGANYYFC